MNPETPWRLFIALPIPPPLRDRLKALQRDLARCLPARAIRWTHPEQIHLTLRFLGNVASESVAALSAAMDRAATHTGPIPLRLAEPGCFPNRHRSRVFWVGLAGDLERLTSLQARVVAATGAFGDHAEDKSFLPHLTLGRTGAHGLHLPEDWGRSLEQEAQDDWIADRLLLVRSELDPAGARHTTLATVKLAEPAGA
jgi:2'-5' RNA ligase